MIWAFFENLGAYPGLQPALRNQTDFASGKRLQLLGKGLELDQANPHPRLEFHQNVNIAFRSQLATDCRAKQ